MLLLTHIHSFCPFTITNNIYPAPTKDELPQKIKVKLLPEIHSQADHFPISPFHSHEVRNPNTAAGVAVDFSCIGLTSNSTSR